MPIGGFSTPRPGLPHPVGAHALTRSSAWRLGAFPVRVAQYEDRRVLVIGLCGASDDEVRGLADHLVPADAAWRWPGAYAVVEEAPGGVVVHTDPASALPLYAVAWAGRGHGPRPPGSSPPWPAPGSIRSAWPVPSSRLPSRYWPRAGASSPVWSVCRRDAASSSRTTVAPARTPSSGARTRSVAHRTCDCATPSAPAYGCVPPSTRAVQRPLRRARLHHYCGHRRGCGRLPSPRGHGPSGRDPRRSRRLVRPPRRQRIAGSDRAPTAPPDRRAPAVHPSAGSTRDRRTRPVRPHARSLPGPAPVDAPDARDPYPPDR